MIAILAKLLPPKDAEQDFEINKHLETILVRRREVQWFGKLGTWKLFAQNFFFVFGQKLFRSLQKEVESLLKNEVPRDWWFGKLAKKLAKKR